jgi:hypothetical protein
MDNFQSMSSSTTHYYDDTGIYINNPGIYINNPGDYAYFGTKLTFYIIPTSISNFYSNYATFALANFASNLTSISKNHAMPQGIQFYTSEPASNGYTLILNTSYNSVSNSDPSWLYKQLYGSAFRIPFSIALNIDFNNYFNITGSRVNGDGSTSIYTTSIYTSKLIQAICNTVPSTYVDIYPNLLLYDIPVKSTIGNSSVVNIQIINDRASITSSSISSLTNNIILPALFNSTAIGATATSAFIAQLIKVGFPNTINAYYIDQQASGNNSYISPVYPINFNIANNNCTITATNSPLGAITNDNTVPNINPIYDQPAPGPYTINLSISNGATVGTVTWSYSPSSLSGVSLSGGNTLNIPSGSINSQIYITATATGQYNNKNAASTISFKLS